MKNIEKRRRVLRSREKKTGIQEEKNDRENVNRVYWCMSLIDCIFDCLSVLFPLFFSFLFSLKNFLITASLFFLRFFCGDFFCVMLLLLLLLFYLNAVTVNTIIAAYMNDSNNVEKRGRAKKYKRRRRRLILRIINDNLFPEAIFAKMKGFPFICFCSFCFISNTSLVHIPNNAIFIYLNHSVYALPFIIQISIKMDGVHNIVYYNFPNGMIKKKSYFLPQNRQKRMTHEFIFAFFLSLIVFCFSVFQFFCFSSMI